MKNKIFWLTITGIAFAYIESSVVVYLRKIYYPEGFAFPVVIAEPGIALTEIFREAATLILMYGIARLAFQKRETVFAAYIILFGVWDIFYYLFLKILLGWPESLMTWDILFLLPFPWAGPVWAPVLVALSLTWAGTVILLREERGAPIRGTGRFWTLEIICAAVIIISFLIPGKAVIDRTVPHHFPWYVFFAGYIPGILLFISEILRKRPVS